MDENQVETTEVPNAPQLSVVDLQNVRSIIDLAVRRGAFSASEASSVGQVFDRLNGFLNSVAQQSEQTTAESSEQTE